MAPGTLTPGRAWLWGGLAVGTLDILDALIFFGLKGVSPLRILQSIASGLLGPKSFEGGIPTAILGGFLHYFIAFSIVGVFLGVTRRLPALNRQPFLWGPVYGLLVFLVMYLVVLPLSAAGGGLPKTAPGLANALLIHAFGIGLPSALFARGAAPGSRPGPRA